MVLVTNGGAITSYGWYSISRLSNKSRSRPLSVLFFLDVIDLFLMADGMVSDVIIVLRESSFRFEIFKECLFIYDIDCITQRTQDILWTICPLMVQGSGAAT